MLLASRVYEENKGLTSEYYVKLNYRDRAYKRYAVGGEDIKHWKWEVEDKVLKTLPTKINKRLGISVDSNEATDIIRHELRIAIRNTGDILNKRIGYRVERIKGKLVRYILSKTTNVLMITRLLGSYSTPMITHMLNEYVYEHRLSPNVSSGELNGYTTMVLNRIKGKLDIILTGVNSEELYQKHYSGVSGGHELLEGKYLITGTGVYDVYSVEGEQVPLVTSITELPKVIGHSLLPKVVKEWNNQHKN